MGAIKEINARTIYILPNNSNIIMAAKQAADVTSGKNVIVLETKSIPQGLTACINFNPEDDAETNTARMKEGIDNVRSGSVTYAIKDTSIEGREIHAGDYMGILEKDIVVTHNSKTEAAKELIRQMCDDDSEVVTLIKGTDASDEEMTELEAFINDNYDVDVDVQDGGQPVYAFVIGVE